MENWATVGGNWVQPVVRLVDTRAEMVRRVTVSDVDLDLTRLGAQASIRTGHLPATTVSMRAGERPDEDYEGCYAVLADQRYTPRDER